MSTILEPPYAAAPRPRSSASVEAPRAGTGEQALFGAAAFVARAVRRWWLLVAAVPLLAAAVVTVLAVRRPRTYTAAASFLPEARRGAPAGLSGLAAQFGVNVTGGDASQSPPFYLDLLRTRAVLGEVVDSTYTLDGGRRGSYARLVGVQGPTPAHARAAAMAHLSRSVAAAINQKTSVIAVSVTTESAVLSAQLANALVAAVNRFNLERRQSQASAERRFVQRRLEDATAELRAAEARQLRFLQQNRQIGGSPDLSYQQERLEREVFTRQQLVASLTQSYEQSRIDAVRDTPVITVVETAVPPLQPDPRGLVGKALLSLLVGAAAGTLAAAHLERRRVGRAAP